MLYEGLSAETREVKSIMQKMRLHFLKKFQKMGDTKDLEEAKFYKEHEKLFSIDPPDWKEIKKRQLERDRNWNRHIS